MTLDTAPTTIADTSPQDPTSPRAGSGRRPWTDVAADLAEDLAVGAAQRDLAGVASADVLDELRRAGLTSMLVPVELGGGGATYAEACEVLTRLARGCASTSLMLSMHTHLVAAQLWRLRHDLPAPVLARVAEEGVVLVSTGASDWLGSNGTAVPLRGGFRVNARKSPASGAPVGDVVVSSVRWDDAPDGAQVVHFAVPLSAPGVTVESTWDALGMRATGSDTVVFTDVEVPESAVALMRPADVWHPVWATVLGAALPLIMASYVGVADAAVDVALRSAAGRSDAAGSAVAVGRMLRRRATARDGLAAMVALAADMCFAAEVELAAEMLVRKANVADAVIDTVTLAMEAGGGATFAAGSVMGRLLRDVHGAVHHPLPAPASETFAGRVAMGLDPVASPVG